MSHRNYRRKLITSLHPYTSTWQSNVTTNSGTYNDTDTNALNDFMNSIDSFKSKFARLNLFMGGDLLACLVPVIYNEGNNFADTNHNFVSGDYSRTTGLGNASNTTKYLTCGFNFSNSSIYLQNNAEVGFGSLTNSNGGAEFSSQVSSFLNFIIKFTDNYCYSRMNSSTLKDFLNNITTIGLFSMSRNSSTEYSIFLNNNLLYTHTEVSITKPNEEIQFFTNNSYYSKKKSGIYYISSSLTSGERAILSAAWTTLNTAIGR